ncbi:hypothetical protein HDU76_001655 [Blyttiomyces sp. JEL0837]|nr:hypothetical protein HDU76_001655 [Blyttiomyces sp. JEL0837]
MSRRVFTPANQNRLTNVSVVRLKKGGQRFEIACYKNKVMEWRNNVETDLDEVLQTHSIYINVSKGQMASQEDIMKAFGSDDTNKIILEILKKGELQVGEKERSAQIENQMRDVATTVAEKCVNPDTKRPYPVTMIEKAMQDVHFSINPNKSAKQQALDVIRLLQEKNTIPIARAHMRLKITTPGKDGKRIKEKLSAALGEIEDEDYGDQFELICLVDPGQFRFVSDTVSAESKGRGLVEVLSIKNNADGDEKF